MVLSSLALPDAESGNVIAEIPGGTAANDIVLAGAHLDSWDLGTGAVDDGAGVAAVVAAASLLLDQFATPPRRTIRVVLFGSEEVGLVGARAYAAFLCLAAETSLTFR
jgi:Zn-dependent M28 family amino/carboxypeptidase